MSKNHSSAPRSHSGLHMLLLETPAGAPLSALFKICTGADATSFLVSYTKTKVFCAPFPQSSGFLNWFRSRTERGSSLRGARTAKRISRRSDSLVVGAVKTVSGVAELLDSSFGTLQSTSCQKPMPNLTLPSDIHRTTRFILVRLKRQCCTCAPLIATSSMKSIQRAGFSQLHPRERRPGVWSQCILYSLRSVTPTSSRFFQHPPDSTHFISANS